jgi:Zn-dependent peptidase ImmA (M78 family)/transcriptional regulator with XRE-family HTH domain
MLGERIKLARKMKGLSLRALADKAGVSAQAISKYERALDVPGSAVLLRLAQALDVRVEFFFRRPAVSLSLPEFRKCAALTGKQMDAVLGQVHEWLERYLEVEQLLGEEVPASRFDLPNVVMPTVACLEDAEASALSLRVAWNIGTDAIESIVELLEDRGIRVGLVDGRARFDACTLWANDAIPVIAVRRDLPGDRQRFSLAHELGHLVLQTAPEVDAERAAHRLAGAFLVPACAARRELGERRHNLGVQELYLLKHKYGLSMQGWIYRARDLGIITDATATALFKRFRQNGWQRCEPGDQLRLEVPQRMQRLVLRALAEDLISETRAAELLGQPLTHIIADEAEQHAGLPVALCCRAPVC